jgi:Glyoxalase-like domain
MHVQVDHLVVACHSLDQGSAWCRETLGAEPVTGARHALMGTHSRRLKVSSPTQADVFLELLALDPDAAPPQRARWFGLDDAALQTSLQVSPRLIGWGGRSPQIDMHRWGLMTVGLQPGTLVKLESETPAGLVRSQVLLRDDGALQLGGALPVLVQWSGALPATLLPECGVGLRQLAVRALPPRAVDVMRLRGVTPLDAAEPVLRATLDTPLGERVLVSG